ncbi:OPT oligopeptide transporter protein-domain-containing protein, partial [Chytridium lagenaria]
HCLLLFNIIIGSIVCHFGGFDLPWWGVLMALALAVVSILPIGIVQAISGQQVGLNVMSELVIGLILPGRIAAVMAFKTLSYMAMYQGLLMVSDLKLGHYVKVPPRAMFLAQLSSTLVSSVINVFVAFSIYESFGRDPNLRVVDEDPNSPKLWKIQTNSYNVFLNAGAIWGAIGPSRFFGPTSPYYATLLGFPIGLLAPLIPYLLHRYFPTSFFHLINIPLLLHGPRRLSAPPAPISSPPSSSASSSTTTQNAIVTHGERKHAYVLSAALDSGLAVSLAVVFACVQSNAAYLVPFPAWLLNRADGEVCAPEVYLTCMDHRRWGMGLIGLMCRVKRTIRFVIRLIFREIMFRAATCNDFCCSRASSSFLLFSFFVSYCGFITYTWYQFFSFEFLFVLSTYLYIKQRFV